MQSASAVLGRLLFATVPSRSTISLVVLNFRRVRDVQRGRVYMRQKLNERNVMKHLQQHSHGGIDGERREAKSRR